MLKRGPQAEANRLYWQTDQSVAQIADQLAVSRRALYELITPQGAGAACAQCGAVVVFVNRSAKSANLARCPDCGTECEITADANDMQEHVPPYVAGWPPAAAIDPGLRARAVKMGSVAVAGAAVGAIAGLLIVRRR